MLIKIKIRNINDEFQVQWIENGKKNEAKTYYTDDEDDAIATKHQMKREVEKLMKAKQQYKVEYRILDEPGIRELYHGVSATSVAQATDFAEKMLINDGLKFSSFEITKVELVT